MKKYCVIMLHYNGAEYAEVIHCPFQVPDEAVYSGSFKECEKRANRFNVTELQKKHNTDNILLITTAEIFAKIIYHCKSKELDVYAKMLWDLGAFSTAEVLEMFSWRIKQGNVNTTVLYEIARIKFDERITKYLPD